MCGVMFNVPQPTAESIVTTAFPDVTGEEKIDSAVPDVEHLPDVLHIQCPNGHSLETPRDMLNQDVLCPYCNSQFRLREKESVEYKKRREQEIEGKEMRLSKAWMNWAIVLAAVLALALALIIASATG